MKVAFYTLGCKVNQYDTQMMVEKVKAANYEICSFNEKADIYVINTCTVTQISDKKSRNIASRAKKVNPDSIVVVCGCFSQVAPDTVSALKNVDIVLGTKNRKDIVKYLEEYLVNKNKIVDVTNEGGIDKESITDFSEKTRAIIKIEDGCRNFCSYCLIPFARGKIVSKKLDNIVAEATDLSNNGYKEIVLTGIHLSSYGIDLENVDLADAIIAVNNIDSVKRIRLGSLEPRIITSEFLSKVKDCDKLCPSFHLSLQSGCDTTLKNMNRKYTTAQYRQAVKLLRDSFKDCAITTDIIVGFPGESDKDFNECLEFAKEISFAKIHIFPYSIRKGTKAASMPDQIEKSIKTAREKLLMEVEENCRLNFNKSLIGKNLPVLVEQLQNGIYTGFTPNYVSVSFKSEKALTNEIVNVKVIDATATELKCELI